MPTRISPVFGRGCTRTRRLDPVHWIDGPDGFSLCSQTADSGSLIMFWARSFREVIIERFFVVHRGFGVNWGLAVA